MTQKTKKVVVKIVIFDNDEPTNIKYYKNKRKTKEKKRKEKKR